MTNVPCKSHHIAALLVLVVACLGRLPTATARINALVVSEDTRFVFSVETFGFLEGGTANLQLSHVRARTTRDHASEAVRMGFVLRKVPNAEAVVEELQTLTISKSCILDSTSPSDYVFDVSDQKTFWAKSELAVPIKDAGLYALLYSTCSPEGTAVWFTLKTTFQNPDGDFLSAGERPLPTMYLLLALVAGGMFIAWLTHLRRNSAMLHHVHHMMTGLMLFKTLSLLFESIMYHFIRRNGHTVGWSVLYYIFTFLKGTMFFVVVLLIGTGWSLLKPFLNEREKKTMMVVLPLQVLSNTAYIVLSELEPGAGMFSFWSNVLHIIDIICCCLVIFPIVWSINNLRRAAEADGKAEDTLARLKQFRQFYLMVVGYIYFTRIFLAIMVATLPYLWVWVANFCNEFVTLLFFGWTGYKYRPSNENVYLRVNADSDDEAEGDEESGAPNVELSTVRRTGAGGGASASSGKASARKD